MFQDRDCVVRRRELHFMGEPLERKALSAPSLIPNVEFNPGRTIEPY